MTQQPETETSFTPGPWAAYDAGSKHRTLISSNCEDYAPTKNGGVFVAVAQGPDNRANARLIAAAPDLYAALEEVTAELAEFADITINGEADTHMTGMVERARAALSKARRQA